jgi:hypothetical protein
MNLEQIKLKLLGSETAPLPLDRMMVNDNLTDAEVAALTPEQQEARKTEWLRFWQNDTRTSIIVHQDTVPKLKGSDKIGIKTSTESGAQGDYTLHCLVIYKDKAEITL